MKPIKFDSSSVMEDIDSLMNDIKQMQNNVGAEETDEERLGEMTEVCGPTLGKDQTESGSQESSSNADKKTTLPDVPPPLQILTYIPTIIRVTTVSKQGSKVVTINQ